MTRYLDESDVMMVEEGFTTRDLLESLLLKVAQTVRIKAVGFPGTKDGGRECVCVWGGCISFTTAHWQVCLSHLGSYPLMRLHNVHRIQLFHCRICAAKVSGKKPSQKWKDSLLFGVCN